MTSAGGLCSSCSESESSGVYIRIYVHQLYSHTFGSDLITFKNRAIHLIPVFFVWCLWLYATVLSPEIIMYEPSVKICYLPFSKNCGQLLFHLISKLYERVFMLITTNLTFGE